MAEDYYDEEAMNLEESSDAPEASQRGATEGGESALLPKSLLMGREFNPGDEVVLKIVHIYEDEVEVQHATEEPEEEESTPMMDAESQMDEMAVSGEGGGY